MIKFEVIGDFNMEKHKAKNTAYLIYDQWDDFHFKTTYFLIFSDRNGERHKIGPVKIGYINQPKGSITLSINLKLSKFDDAFFSLGQTDSYYEKLNNLGDETRDEILQNLNDIAKSDENLNIAIQERVTKVSLLRFVSLTTVKGQFKRLANGGIKLTEYKFSYIPPRNNYDGKKRVFTFNVDPESFPPTNIHVLIGRNGVGKTYLLNNMVNTLLEENQPYKFGQFIEDNTENNNHLFANLVSVSFSAFDESEPRTEKRDKTKNLRYSYIGLKRLQIGEDKNNEPKSTLMLKNEFLKSLEICKRTSKIDRWKESILMLETDPNFKEVNIVSLAQLIDNEGYKEIASNIFKSLSSGHKIVILTLTRLIETLQERSLVLIDEPEAHLHPPLLSAFMRSLSELLVKVNGVALIATHSPVILQEVPRSCCYKMRRSGSEFIAERLVIESFGENVGVLTKEVFGLEVTHSGFYNLLQQAVELNDDYEQALSYLNNQLGTEGRAVLMTMMNLKNNKNEKDF